MKTRIALVVLGVLLAGCGGGIVGELSNNYDAMIESGWERYNQRRYDDAYQIFQNARRQDAERPEAYIGSGWALLRRQRPDSAVVAFRTSFDYITTLADSVDSICGLSGSYLAANENTKVIETFTRYTVSSFDEAFPLKKHDFFLDERDIEIVQALALYRLGLYSPNEKANPDNALWHVNRLLYVPMEYTGAKSLMEALVDFIKESKGDILL